MQYPHFKHLQNLINNSTGFVCNRYVKVNNVIKLKWNVKRVSFCSSKLVFKIVNDNTLVDYHSLNFKKSQKTTKSREQLILNQSLQRRKRFRN